MIALKQIEYLLPKNKIIIKKKYRSISNLFLKEKIGSTELPRFSEKDTVINICTNLIKKKNSN